jgi:DNA-binding NarL/FixJ family response regulator
MFPRAEAIVNVLTALRKVLDGEVYISPKFSDRLIFKLIRSIDNGMDSPVDTLSDRELEVLRLLGKGFGSCGVAKELYVSVKTFETHRAHIKEKLGFQDPAERVRFAIDWVTLEEG